MNPKSSVGSGDITIVEAEVHAGSARTPYLRAGSGPAVVLLHGSAEGVGVWVPWMSWLGARFCVLAPALPEWKTGDDRFEPRACPADWLRDFLDGLGVESVRMLARGDSIGIAARFADAYPERVSDFVPDVSQSYELTTLEFFFPVQRVI
jgi:pimeloyl-ACP methyl ester carboxylesterase